MTELKASTNRVIVKQTELEEITKGGIFIPQHLLDNSDKKPLNGKIMSVGYDIKNPDLKEGTLVYFTNWAGVRITDEDEEFIVLQESDVLAYK